MNENSQNAIIIVLLIFIALKVYKEDIEKLGDIIGKIIASIIIVLIFLKSTQKPLSINVLSIRGSENAKKRSLINSYYVKNTPCFQYKIG